MALKLRHLGAAPISDRHFFVIFISHHMVGHAHHLAAEPTGITLNQPIESSSVHCVRSQHQRRITRRNLPFDQNSDDDLERYAAEGGCSSF